MICALLYGAWAFLKRDERSLSARTFVIAALVPLSGVFPDLVAGLLLLTLLSLDICARGSRSIRWAVPAIVLTIVWAATRWVSEFDIAPFVNLFAGRDGPGDSGLTNILRWLRGGPPGYYVAIEDCIRLVCIVSLGTVLSGARGATFARGLIVGGSLCAVCALVEWFAPQTFEMVRPPQLFWKGIDRMSGLATDPNALGVFVGALIPIAYAQFKGRSWPVIALLSVGGIYSGSRSFFLLPVVTAGYVVWRRKGLGFAILLVGTIATFCLILIASSSLLPHPPSGLLRLRESLDPTRIAATFESRTIFTRLCLEAFWMSPLVGVGLGQFDEYVVPLSHSLNLGTGLWRDGATSVYLEILCELGVVGVLMFLTVALSVRRAEGADVWYRGLGVAVLVVLAVVPHTNFPEGVSLAGLLLAQTVTPRFQSCRRLHLATAAASLLVPFLYAPNATYGFYPWEQNERGYIRWTAAESAGVFSCNDAPELSLLNASPVAQDIEVRTASGSQLQTLQQGESLSIPLPCKEQRASYLLNVSPGFTPSKYGFRGDDRLLGVRQLSPKPIL